jgi:histidyl-tRNA synthetase
MARDHKKPEIGAKKLSTEPYKGVRDFYPEDMAIQEYIFNTWKKTAESFGYEQYNASVLEPAELFIAKSGEEIVTLRPEMTPSVARMVAARKRELSFPLRWYSVANLFRYEQPQRGRVREHWQLNVDIFGSDSVEADVEVIALAYQVMRAFGAKDEDFEIRINNLQLMYKWFAEKYKIIDKNTQRQLLKILDQKRKIAETEFKNKLMPIISQERYEQFRKELDLDIDSFVQMVNAEREHSSLIQVKDKLNRLGIKNVVFDATVTRGADYYTGVIFEIYDTNPENRRSLFGGGRYDDLTSLFGGDKVPAVGFGMGDVTIRDFLETHKLLPLFKSSTEIHICTLDEKFIPDAEALAAKLRAKGTAVSVNLTAKKIGDQIGWADKHRIPKIIVIGEEEVKTGKYKLKTLDTGEEI